MPIRIDLFAQEPRKLEAHEVDSKAADARALLNYPVFRDAMNDIYSRAAGTLSTAEVGSLTAATAHATMRSIMDIKAQLENFVTDDKMRQKFAKPANLADT